MNNLNLYILVNTITLLVYAAFIAFEKMKNPKNHTNANSTEKPKQTSNVSVKEQIKQLEQQLYASDDGKERNRLLKQIRELEQQ